MEQRKLSSLDSHKRLPEFAKNASDEDFILALNESLKELESEQLMLRKSDRSYPTILVVSAPRTGSTLLTQVLASRLNVGYISNLMARFYNTPMVGARLQNLILANKVHELRSYKSKHGVTPDIYEPHEFGYFWSRHLSFGKPFHQPESISDLNKIDFKNLDLELQGITSSFQKPTVMKCPLGVFFVKQLLEYTNSYVIYLTREFDDLQRSILRVRKDRLGSETEWWSIRPSGFEEVLTQSPKEQVAWQINQIESAVEEGIIGHESRVIKCDYNSFVDEPEIFITELLGSFESHYKQAIERAGKPVAL